MVVERWRGGLCPPRGKQVLRTLGGYALPIVLAIASVTPVRAFSKPSTQVTTITNRVAHIVGRGDSLGSILARYGVRAGETHRWWTAARPTRDLSNLVVGHKLDLSFSNENRLMRLGYQIDQDQRLIVEEDPAGGKLHARVVEPSVVIAPIGARGRLDRSFYASAQKAGIPESIISEMVDILSVRIDLGSKVRPGDRFRVLYEGRYDDRGRALRPGRVLAAEYYGANQTVAAFLYEDESGRTAYVDKTGRALDDSLLRYPLDFTRITSTFSYSRFHPILKTRKPHLGVDFAAPTGTPVRAIGAGKIRWAAWQGSFGRHVEVDHGSAMISAYSHLSRIHPSVQAGKKVERGQVIGWVGSSGRATGPHLHFAIFENGRYVNPMLTRRAPTVGRVEPRRFASQRENLSAQLRAMTTHHSPQRSAQPVALSSLTQAEHLRPATLTF